MSARHLFVALVLSAVSMPGCSLLPGGNKKPPTQVFLLAPAPPSQASAAGLDCGTIQVGAGNAATGQRGPRMAYMRDAYEIDYFAFARWGDPPTFMLRDQARQFLRASGRYRGVLASPVTARTDWQLELGDVTLVQKFSGEVSSLVMGFEARLFDGDRRTLIATQRLEAVEQAGDDARSGVQAANRAATALLARLVDFALEACDRRAQ